MTLSICISDWLHLYLLVAILNTTLFLIPHIKFQHVWYKICTAVDLGVVLMTFLQTSMGESDDHWPQDAKSNLWIAFCFSAFFYIVGPRIWGVMFLLVGLLSVTPVWDAVYTEIQAFASHSLDLIIDQTHVSWIKGVIVLGVMVVVLVCFFFAIPTVQLISMCFTTTIKLVISIKVIWIIVFKQNRICCSAESSRDTCPFWFSPIMRAIAAAFFVMRVPIALHMQDTEMVSFCQAKTNTYQAVSTDTEIHFAHTDSQAGDEADPPPAQRRNEDTSKGSRLRTIAIARPQRGRQ